MRIKNSALPVLFLAILLCTILPVTAAPEDYDHYVSFHLRANALAPTYAYDLVTRGEPSDGSQWVYNMYLFGKDSGGLDGRIQVFACGGHGTCLDQISPLSAPLVTGREYDVVWQYSDTGGGELFVNNISQGAPAGSGSLPVSLSSSFHFGENMYTGQGRRHSAFNGAIWGISHYDRDLSPAAGNNGSAGQAGGFTIAKTVSPESIKQGTTTRITITLTNNGTTPVHDIEIRDGIRPELPVESGDTQYKLPGVLQPGETRIFSYTVQGTIPGRYVLNRTQVLYAGEDGNYHQLSSRSPLLTVLEPLIPEESQAPVSFPRIDPGKSLSDILKKIFS
jgi:uncharacterized repeat protein (TIGR01451 family)